MRTRWTTSRVTAVACGGVAGAGVRWAVLTRLDAGGEFPWPLLLINLAGSLVLGVALAEEWTHPRARLGLHDVVGIGFCGGLTTFSTLALEAARLLDDGDPVMALTYGGASLAGAPLAVLGGALLFRRARAVALPLEEQP